jgi:predicted transcriptional regulator
MDTPPHSNTIEYTAVYDMPATTVKIQPETKKRLDRFREYRSETYDELIAKLIFIAELSQKDPELSRETIEAIEKARARMKRGRFVSEAEAARRLGL